MFSSYSSFILHFCKLKKKKKKEISCSHHFSTHREDFLHYVQPWALAGRQGKRQTGSLFLRPFCDSIERVPEKGNLLSPATKQTPRISAAQRSIIQINGHSPKLLLPFVKANTVLLIRASKQLQVLFLCTMHNAQIVGVYLSLLKGLQYAARTICCSLFSWRKEAGITCIRLSASF